MAIISIPSSIAGISVPGTSSKGPLGVLFDNPFNQDILQYPKDLNSATKGHVVQFGVLEIIPVQFGEVKDTIVKAAESAIESTGNFLAAPGEAISDAADAAIESAVSIGKSLGATLKTAIKEGGTTTANKAVNSLANSAENTFNGLYDEKYKLNFTPKRTKVKSYISLYMPDTVNIGDVKANYGEPSVTTELGKSLTNILNVLVPGKKGAEGISSATGGIINNFATLGLGAAGYAINPQIQVLFQGIGFREFQMAFIFTPNSREESQTVEKIIKIFRQNALPKVQSGLAGMFFVAPSAFSIKFFFNGKENTHLNKIKDSVITGIDINYAPNGWAAHDDGAPVQTTMTVQFKELELVDSNQVKEGY